MPKCALRVPPERVQIRHGQQRMDHDFGALGNRCWVIRRHWRRGEMSQLTNLASWNAAIQNNQVRRSIGH